MPNNLKVKSNKHNESICAVVVTYNRKEILLECLSAIMSQKRILDAIYIIDNASTDGTRNILFEKGYINKVKDSNLSESLEITCNSVFDTDKKDNSKISIVIHYARMNSNSGCAGGFYEGVKRAYEKGYDWLWLIDDDGFPDDSTLQKLLICTRKHNLSVIGPVVLCKNNTQKIFAPFNKMDRNEFFSKYKDSIIYDVLPVFNGALYHRSIIKKVGFPDKSLFIWGDEDDYRKRVSAITKIAVTTEALYYHPQLFNYKKGKFLGRNFKYSISPTWKIYYQLRNRTYLSIYKKQNFNIIKKFLIQIIVDVKYRKKNRLKSLFYHFKAIFDGATKRLGKRIEIIE